MSEDYKSQQKILKKAAKSLKPVVRIGKNSLTEGIINEIKTLLKKRGIIKIKVLKNCLANNEIDKIIMVLSEEQSILLVERIGLTFTLARKGYSIKGENHR